MKTSNHIEGSRKSKVHALFDKQGQDAAWTLGKKLGLAEASLRSWFSAWRREAAQPKVATKANGKVKADAKAKAKPEAKTAKAKAKAKTSKEAKANPDGVAAA
jgi:hypothetical protein